MLMNAGDLQALWLSIQLAFTVTCILLVLCTPLAWWLASGSSLSRHIVATFVALPLVLPPSVLGFYLLIFFSPDGPMNAVAHSLGLDFVAFKNLAFSFKGLVVASCIYSLPFVVQPIHNSMRSIGTRPLELAATLGASPIDRFFTVVVPLSKNGFLGASVLGFAHTLGEFGIVLMIGGSIPGETKVASVQIYDHVEALNYQSAHTLSAILLVFSFGVLFLVYRKSGMYILKNEKTSGS